MAGSFITAQNIRRFYDFLMFHFYTPWKQQKTFAFLTFSGDRKMERWAKLGWNYICAAKIKSIPFKLLAKIKIALALVFKETSCYFIIFLFQKKGNA